MSDYIPFKRIKGTYRQRQAGQDGKPVDVVTKSAQYKERPDASGNQQIEKGVSVSKEDKAARAASVPGIITPPEQMDELDIIQKKIDALRRMKLQEIESVKSQGAKFRASDRELDDLQVMR